jgi:hypothetical protein
VERPPLELAHRVAAPPDGAPNAIGRQPAKVRLPRRDVHELVAEIAEALEVRPDGVLHQCDLVRLEPLAPTIGEPGLTGAGTFSCQAGMKPPRGRLIIASTAASPRRPAKSSR